VLKKLGAMAKSDPETLRRKNGKAHRATVLIASATPGVRQRWALGLQDACLIHEVSERAELERAMTDSRPGVLLLDSDLLRPNEAEGVSTIQRLSPSTKIILFAGARDEEEAIRALKAGAKGYCSKDIQGSLLPKAVNVVQKGEIWVGRKTISLLLTELTSMTESHREDRPTLSKVYLNYLTPRERQIALLIGEGACNKEISSQLNISERTVKAHLSTIFRKLQIPDRLRLGLFVNGRGRPISN
jgi:DNA-binding NarL/FixJ family response regulator